MITTQIHNIEKVTLFEEKRLTTDNGREFVSRWLIIKTADSEVTISLIADESFEVILK